MRAIGSSRLATVIATAGLMIFSILPLSAQTKSAPPASQQMQARDQLERLLREFLDAAGRGDKPVFERFFADDVIYTRGTGQRVDKAEILQGVEEGRTSGSTYSADDAMVHDYGDFAVVNFRLLAHSAKEGRTDTTTYRNTGVFQRRNGRWQVIAWQATPISAQK